MSQPLGEGSDWAREVDSRPRKRRRSSEEREERRAGIARLPPTRLASPSRHPSHPRTGDVVFQSSTRGEAFDQPVRRGGQDGRYLDIRPNAAVGASTSSEWYYELEIIQQPQRARACGFGDKDRRPLSPPPILRLWVRTASGQLVDPTHVSIQFLVLMVDLWSADGQQQRNVVMHPGSQPARTTVAEYDAPIASSSRPGTATSRPGTGYGANPIANPLPPSTSSPGTSPLARSSLAEGVVPAPLPVPDYTQGRPTYPRTQSFAAQYEAEPIPVRPLTAPSPRPPAFQGTGRSPLTLPSLASLTRSDDSRSMNLTLPAMLPTIQDLPSGASPLLAPSQQRVSWSEESGRRGVAGDSRPRTSSGWSEGPRTGGGMSSRPSTSGGWYGSPYSTPRNEHPYASSESSYGFPSTPEAPPAILPTGPANYSRVLVGQLSTVCQRLQDAEGNLGLFFFAHDLGVRTEGVFTLKFSLTNLASLMSGSVAPGERTGTLAEAYSDPFTVYSAKRFPGVIPTTDLTRLFAGQNVRLPTRQRRAQDSPDDSGDE